MGLRTFLRRVLRRGDGSGGAAAGPSAADGNAAAIPKDKGSRAPKQPASSNSSPDVPGAVTRLAYQLLRSSVSQLAAGDPGAFISPLSVYYALALALNGAGPGSSTHKQILGLLASGSGGMDGEMNEEALNGEIASHMGTVSAPVKDGATMLIANGIFTKTSINGAYTSHVKALFGAASQQVQDEVPINAWVKEATQGEIDTLVPPGPFDTALVNALYFKGLWVDPFDAEKTKPKLFHAPAGDRTVSMMRHTFEGRSRARCLSMEGVYDAVMLPYRGSTDAGAPQFAALAVLPTEGSSVDKTLASLARDDTDAPKPKVHSPDKTIIELPKFRAESSSDLSPVLKALGMTDAFKSDADFSRISAGLYVSHVLHKAVVEVDEAGTVAAAATAVMMTRSMPMPSTPYQLTFDRPFVFYIMHATTNTPVFMGVVQSPPEHVP